MKHKRGRISSIGDIISGVVFFTMLGKALGFLRELLLSYFFGATGISDAYIISQNIPGSIFQFIATGLMTCFIPVYLLALNAQGEKEAHRFTDRIITFVLIFSIFIIIIVFVFTDTIVRAFASGFDVQTMGIAVKFTKIGILSLLFSAFLYVFNSFLQANESFFPIAVSTIPYNLFLLLSIVLGAKINVFLLPICSTFAVLFQLFFVIPSIRNKRYSYRLNFTFNDKYFISFIKLLGPVLVGVSINEINTLIDKTIASQISIGGISALAYASSLINLIQGGLVQPVATVFYPKITKSIAEDIECAKKQVNKAINTILQLLIPVTLLLCVFSKQIVILLFQRGSFDENATSLTVMALIGYTVGVCSVGVREILVRYFYACKDTKNPMISTAIGMSCNIILNIILSHYLGILGISLATSISAFLVLVMLWYKSRNIGSSLTVSLDWKELLKTIVASVVTICIIFCLYNWFETMLLLKLLITFVLGICIYIFLAMILRIKLICEAINHIKTKIVSEID